ncbi:hypothetical protein [Arthrobacter sp. 35W]|uniref:hypothetical protein n=1 Tax=Arthrobacter sp. 35W TaxID=1132441 RepID=UPI000427C65C|nr:hypothetical protein [Arthrobacter sp. 35W]
MPTNKPPLPSRERLQFGWSVAGLSIVLSVLVWTLWVIPVNRSIEAAAPVTVGEPVVQELDAGETIGIWASGISASLGTVECAAIGPDGQVPTISQRRDLDWDDTLWWVTARPGFKQVRWFTATLSGSHTITCVDSLGTYGGEYLLADSANGEAVIGVGSSGGVKYPASSMLAFAAVGAPLLAVLLVPIMAVQTIRSRRSRVAGRRPASDGGSPPNAAPER